MKRVYLYLITGLSIIAGAASAYFINTGNGLSAALAGLAGFLFLEYGKEKSIELKNRKQVKALNSTSTTLLEVVLIGGLLASQSLPIKLSVAVLSSLVFVKALKSNSENFLNTDVSLRFDQRGRVITALAAMALSIFNPYYIFIGAWVLLGSVIVDTAEILYDLQDRSEKSKLKNRIMSN
ncbi:hypothetical protein ACK3SF_03740 [Candidatus Nanosalina sp. VS9-1]|uniref:hypothetical protein n=1 Tax=Candidatus Nanosalina sp. VS9-1 TaxID=3388566 RepID=UPI0039E0BFD1